MKTKIKKIIGRLDSFRLKSFGRTQKAVYIITMLLIGIAQGAAFIDSGLPRTLSFIAFFIVSIIAANIALAAIYILIKFLLRNGITYIICFTALTAGLTELIYTGNCDNITYPVCILFAAVVVWLLLSYSRSLWALLINKVRTKTVLISFIISGLLLVPIIAFIFSDGFENRYIDEYYELSEIKDAPRGFEAELSQGSYTPAFLYYGDSEKAVLESDTINLGDYVGGYTGLQKTYRKLYQGYDIYSVPLTGKVWYPKELNNCPVLFIAHGNHNLTTPSYEGYDYLGKYLASHGYVVVSLDSNSCNGSLFGGLSGDNDGRAILMLKSIRQVLKYNRNKETPLYHKIDESNIAVSGHSRGGEAAALAALFNDLEKNPSDGTENFLFGYNIKSVIAIAPCVNQYKPADHEVELKNVNYLLIHGSNDQDVTSNMGARQFENISFEGEGDYIKSALYIAGANHGQFNTLWGRYDMQAPINLFLNTGELISEKEQQDILKVFVKVFLDSTLKGGSPYKSLLKASSNYISALPDTVYTQIYMESGFDMLGDFEGDTDLTEEDDGATEVDVKNSSGWTEELALYSKRARGGGEKGSYVLSLNWYKGKSAKLELDFPQIDCQGKSLQLDIADTDIQGLKRGDGDILDAEVTLIDARGRSATLMLSDYALIYPPLPVNLGKLQHVLNKPEYKILYSTVSIPAADFGGELDIHNISGVTIRFMGTSDGSVNLDNIGFGK